MARFLTSTFCLVGLAPVLAQKVCPAKPDPGTYKLVQYTDSECTQPATGTSEPREFQGAAIEMGKCGSVSGRVPGTSEVIAMSYKVMCQNNNTYLKSYLGEGCQSCAGFTMFNETESTKLFAGGCAAQVHGFGDLFFKYDRALNVHCGCGDIGSPSSEISCSDCASVCKCSSSCQGQCSSVSTSFKECGTCGTDMTCNPSASDFPSASGSVSKALTCLDIKKAYQAQNCCKSPGGTFTVPKGRRLVDDDVDTESNIAADQILAFVEAGMKHIQKIEGRAKSDMFARALKDIAAQYVAI